MCTSCMSIIRYSVRLLSLLCVSRCLPSRVSKYSILQVDTHHHHRRDKTNTSTVTAGAVCRERESKKWKCKYNDDVRHPVHIVERHGGGTSIANGCLA